MANLDNAIAAIGRFFERFQRTAEIAHQRQESNTATKTLEDSVRECERRHYEYFEHLYYNEEKRRDAFTSNFSFLLGVLGIVGAIGTFYLRDLIDWIPRTSLAGLFEDWTITTYFVALAFDLFFLARALYFLVRANYNYTYQYLASPQEIRDYYKSLIDLYESPIQAERAFQQYILDEYASAANTNDKNNITKRKYVHLCTASTIYLSVTLALTFIPFFAHKVVHHEKEPLLIRWDPSARVTLDSLQSPSAPSLFLDKLWPKVEFSLGLSQHAERTQATATPAAEASTSRSIHSEATPAATTAAPVHKGEESKQLKD